VAGSLDGGSGGWREAASLSRDAPPPRRRLPIAAAPPPRRRVPINAARGGSTGAVDAASPPSPSPAGLPPIRWIHHEKVHGRDGEGAPRIPHNRDARNRGGHPPGRGSPTLWGSAPSRPRSGSRPPPAPDLRANRAAEGPFLLRTDILPRRRHSRSPSGGWSKIRAPPASPSLELRPPPTSPTRATNAGPSWRLDSGIDRCVRLISTIGWMKICHQLIDHEHHV